jgi:hypothetical protein
MANIRGGSPTALERWIVSSAFGLGQNQTVSDFGVSPAAGIL